MIDTKGLRLDAAIARAGHMPMKLSGGEIIELIDRLEAAESDALEQARLNGMGSEREAALLSKLEAAEKERDALRSEVESWKGLAQQFGNELDTVRAKIAEMANCSIPLYLAPGAKAKGEEK